MQSEVVAIQVPDSINELMDGILCELRDEFVRLYKMLVDLQSKAQGAEILF